MNWSFPLNGDCSYMSRTHLCDVYTGDCSRPSGGIYVVNSLSGGSPSFPPLSLGPFVIPHILEISDLFFLLSLQLKSSVGEPEEGSHRMKEII